MPSFNNIFAVAGLIALTTAQGFTPPQSQTWGPVLTPNQGSPVTRGVPYTVTWDPENRPVDGVTISLVLCKGPSTNCVTQSTAIASGLAASAKSYTWDVPCSLTPGQANTATGYGLLAIVDGTGEFQFSTQFSVLEGNCGTTTTGSTSGISTTPVPTISLPPFSDTTSSTSTTVKSSVTYSVTFTTSVTTTSSKASNGTTTSHSPSSTTAAYSSTRPAGTTPAQPTFTGAASKLAGGAAAMLAAGVALFAL